VEVPYALDVKLRQELLPSPHEWGS
jgi:hypothetical protein